MTLTTTKELLTLQVLTALFAQKINGSKAAYLELPETRLPIFKDAEKGI